MHSILNLWLIIFWLSVFFFFLNTTNLVKLFVSSEIVWVVLYIYSVLVGIYMDDAQMYVLALFLITLASVEFSIGFILVIFFKKIFKTSNIMDTVGTDWTVVQKLNRF